MCSVSSEKNPSSYVIICHSKITALSVAFTYFWKNTLSCAGILLCTYRLPYARHYNPRLVYFYPIFVVNFFIPIRTFLQKILSLCMATTQEQVMISRIRYITSLTWIVPTFNYYPQWTVNSKPSLTNLWLTSPTGFTKRVNSLFVHYV